VAAQLKTAFTQALAIGKTGESLIALWLRSRGYCILPAYEVELNTGKGPRIFAAEHELVAPDLFAFSRERMFWIEAKHKAAFSHHRITDKWVTGIDLRYYEDYLRLNEITPWPIWLMFLHRGGQAKDSPPDSPAGLFGGELGYLSRHENHRHENWGNGGMVYWAHETLRHLASWQEIETLSLIHQGRTK
jgi:hypothetical protein